MGTKNNLVRKRIQTIAQENGLSDHVQSVFLNLFDYMMKKRLYGGCHAFSSALYVALRELGEAPELCIGTCFALRKMTFGFDHSWITLNGKVIDIAIYMPISQKCNSITGVVIMDIDTATQTKTETKYGDKDTQYFDNDTNVVIQTPFVDYMNAYPLERNGLWTVVQLILPDTYQFDISTIKSRYINTKRIVIGKRP